MPINWTILMNSAPIIVEGAKELMKTINKKKAAGEKNDARESPELNSQMLLAMRKMRVWVIASIVLSAVAVIAALARF